MEAKHLNRLHGVISQKMILFIAATYLMLEATSAWRNGPHSRLTGGIVWAGALSNCTENRHQNN
jgi:hypothetical protein